MCSLLAINRINSLTKNASLNQGLIKAFNNFASKPGQKALINFKYIKSIQKNTNFN